MLKAMAAGFTALCMVIFLMEASVLAAEDGKGARNKQVGLGVIGGAAFPIANSRSYKITESWGFYVDVPIISTFHITPAATLYRLDPKDDTTPTNAGITDLSMNFKFVIPLPGWKIFIAAMMGASNGLFVNNDFIHLHVGGNLGFGYRIVSNLDFVLMGQYKLIVDGDQSNLNMIQAMGGLQFNF